MKNLSATHHPHIRVLTLAACATLTLGLAIASAQDYSAQCVGGGRDFSSADIHSPGFFGFPRTSDEIDPAVQGKARVRFRLNAISDLGLGYKFLTAVPNEGRYIGTHAASASFTLRF
jgi:hypothetical protein